jgi:aromatic ring-opening dioxygenase catalytic subunit (LigB family)
MHKKMPVVFIPHGGGPMPVLNEPSHAELNAFLRNLGQSLPTPKAILVVSAHWETNTVQMTAQAEPGLLFDYYGFPAEAYTLQYNAPGDPQLAADIQQLLQQHNINSQLNTQRDWDHGVFIPLLLMYPQGNIPVVQISLLNNLDPQKHIALGEALSALREQGVLILGSGLSFHNMQAFFNGGAANASGQFDQWLSTTLCGELDFAAQKNTLQHWQQAPYARYCHPREEHLLPLHVCLGASAGDKCHRPYHAQLLGATVSAFVWA